MTVKQKYLIYLSYVGSNFRGCSIQNKSDVINVLPTVQGTIEEGLNNLLGLSSQGSRPTPTTFTSRTDAGVHAIRNGLHVELPPVSRKMFFKPENIQSYLNKFFFKNNKFITVTEIVKVPDMFHARYSATEKSYLYRLGVLKKEFCTKHPQWTFPITESGRTFFLRTSEFDKSKVQEVTQLFLGEKDFGGFLGSAQKKPYKSTICNIKSFTFEEAEPLMADIDPLSQLYDYYHFICKGQRFLFHLVRKMVGVVLSFAQNRIPIEAVQHLFDEPDFSSWNTKAQVVPGYGLHLLNITFNPDHLVISEEEENQKQQLLEQINLRRIKSI